MLKKNSNQNENQLCRKGIIDEKSHLDSELHAVVPTSSPFLNASRSYPANMKKSCLQRETNRAVFMSHSIT